MASPFGAPFRRGGDSYGLDEAFGDPFSDPLEEESFLRSLGSGTLSAMGFVGDVLDTPGAMMRALLSGNNPFAAIDPDNRVYGSQLFGEDPGVAGHVAGFGIDVLTDPLTYVGGLGLLGKALSTPGRIAQKAGLLSRLSSGAFKKAGVGLGTGPRTALLRSSLDDLLKSLPAVEQPFAKAKLADVASKMGVSNLDSLMNKPLGGALHARVPFTNMEWLPSGQAAQRYAAMTDALGQAVRFGRYSPVRPLAALFETSNRSQLDPFAQKLAQAATAEETQELPKALEALFAAEGNLTRGGLRTAPNDALRLAAEFPSQAAPDLRDALAPLREYNQRTAQYAKSRNLGLKELTDSTIESYFPRQRAPKINQATPTAKSFLQSDATQISRKPILQGIQGGTNTLNKAATQAADILGQGGSKQDVVAMLKTLGIDDKYTKGAKELSGRLRRLTDMFAKDVAEHGAEALKPGLFPNHPLFDAATGLPGSVRTRTTRDTLVRALGDETFLDAISQSKHYAGQPTVSIGQALKQWKLPKAAAQTIADELSQQTGRVVTASDVTAKQLPKSLVEQLGKVDTPLQVGGALKNVLGKYDSFTNLFKAGVLTHPARYVRDFIGGQAQNVLQGQAGSNRGARAVLAGGVLPDAEDLAKLPVVQEALRAQGLSGTPENVTEVVRQMAGARSVLSPLGEIGDAADTIAAGTLDEVSARLPGRTKAATPLSKEWFKTFAGRTKDTSLKPFTLGPKGNRLGGVTSNIRGVGEAAENRFGPLRAGDQAGYWIDSQNRLAPFLKLLKKGMDPTEAAEKIASSQVKYAGSLTPFEKEFVARVFPFARFTKGMVKHVTGELADRPGGPLANVIRGQNALLRDKSDEGGPIPAHVAETMAVPISEGSLLGKILGTPEDKETNRYLTGLGLMHEDAVRLLGQGPANNMLEAISRTNPLIKAAIEQATGRSTFQRGPEGGRPLEELDPTLGRIASNIAGLDSPVGTPNQLEYALGMSPFSRLLSTVRTVTDPRKDTLSKAINTLTGVRTTDVSPTVEDALLRDRLGKTMKQAGAKSFANLYFSKEDLARMSPEERREAQKFLKIRQLLSKRMKQRKEAKSLTPG